MHVRVMRMVRQGEQFLTHTSAVAFLTTAGSKENMDGPAADLAVRPAGRSGLAASWPSRDCKSVSRESWSGLSGCWSSAWKKTATLVSILVRPLAPCTLSVACTHGQTFAVRLRRNWTIMSIVQEPSPSKPRVPQAVLPEPVGQITRQPYLRLPQLLLLVVTPQRSRALLVRAVTVSSWWAAPDGPALVSVFAIRVTGLVRRV